MTICVVCYVWEDECETCKIFQRFFDIPPICVGHSNSPRRKPAENDFVFSTLDGVFNNRGKVLNFSADICL
jgi:hypothetical protein